MLLAVYRPGSQMVSATFYDDLSAVLEQLAIYRCPVVICGDFVRRPDRRRCSSSSAARVVWICSARHRANSHCSAGHTLDLVITRSETEMSDVCTGGMTSDHALRFTLSVKKSHVDDEWRTSRAWRRLSRDAFASDLAVSIGF